MRSMIHEPIELGRERNDEDGVEGSEAVGPYSIAYFSEWHEGWSITELSAPSRSGGTLPALFHGLKWDRSAGLLELLLFPADADLVTLPHRVPFAGVISIQVHLLSGCYPERVLHIKMQTGEAVTMRMNFNQDRRRVYDQFCVGAT